MTKDCVNRYSTMTHSIKYKKPPVDATTGDYLLKPFSFAPYYRYEYLQISF
jgi:hypothetical protein